MKIIEFIEKNIPVWDNESFDIWIEPNGNIHDLGVDSCHLSYIQEKFDKNKTSNELLENNWIKITNTRQYLKINLNKESSRKYRNQLFKIIEQKLKYGNFSLICEIIDTKEKLNLEFPKDKLNFLILF